MDWPLIAIGFGASAAAGIATGVGALPILFIRTLSSALEDALLGFAAGVMLAASFFSLIVPALDFATELNGSRIVAAVIVIAALMLGAVTLSGINRYVPHEHLGLSPQCGFASHYKGTALTFAQQEAKLRLVVETAAEVWG